MTTLKAIFTLRLPGKERQLVTHHLLVSLREMIQLLTREESF